MNLITAPLDKPLNYPYKQAYTTCPPPLNYLLSFYANVNVHFAVLRREPRLHVYTPSPTSFRFDSYPMDKRRRIHSPHPHTLQSRHMILPRNRQCSLRNSPMWTRRHTNTCTRARVLWWCTRRRWGRARRSTRCKHAMNTIDNIKRY